MEKVKVQKQLYGQLVIGPPGAGKSTYCLKMSEFYKQLGRNVCIVNLDPANENMNYHAEIDIMHLITLDDVMEHYVSLLRVYYFEKCILIHFFRILVRMVL